MLAVFVDTVGGTTPMSKAQLAAISYLCGACTTLLITASTNEVVRVVSGMLKGLGTGSTVGHALVNIAESEREIAQQVTLFGLPSLKEKSGSK
jgi:hypothetical protein